MDVLLIGNDFGMEVQQGPADALVGIALKNKGKGEFKSIMLEESHFFVPGDGKSLVSLNLENRRNLSIASQNNDSLRVFEPFQKSKSKLIKLKANEVKVGIIYNNGGKQVQEFYRGSSFQSQSSRYVILRPIVTEVRLFDYFEKETRRIASPPEHNIGATENATKR